MRTPPSAAEQRWREIVERQRASGSTVAAFCRDHHIATSSFFAWKRKLGGSPIGFVEATVVGTPPASPAARASVEVLLRNGRRVRVGRRGFDAGLLAEVVAALEAIA